jgi:hypothetical protein
MSGALGRTAAARRKKTGSRGHYTSLPALLPHSSNAKIKPAVVPLLLLQHNPFLLNRNVRRIQDIGHNNDGNLRVLTRIISESEKFS